MYFKTLIVGTYQKLNESFYLLDSYLTMLILCSLQYRMSLRRRRGRQNERSFVYEYNRLYIPTFIIHLSSVNLIRIQDSHGYFNSTANPFTTASRKVVFYLQLGRYLVRRYVLCFVCFDIEFIWGIVIVVCECKTISGTCFERYRNQY